MSSIYFVGVFAITQTHHTTHNKSLFNDLEDHEVAECKVRLLTANPLFGVLLQ
jgi:hypothetical protein